MAEDQGVNGDIWNNEAAKLLTACGWQPVGDSNMDITSEYDKPQGIDRIFTFNDDRRNPKMPQTVLVEAKCYKTDSFSKANFQKWLITLNDKISDSKNSSDFLEKFPNLKRTMIRNGLIVIWFSNLEDYDRFRPGFQTIKRQVYAPNRRNKSANNIYVIDNYDILRLASVITTIKHFNADRSSKLNYFYPTSENFGHAIARNSQLTLDYMFSKIILMETRVGDIENRVVFYFGQLTTVCFYRLKNLLSSVSFVDKEKPLFIYTYQRDPEFRKIKPDVLNLFGEVAFRLEEMEIYGDLPTFMK